MTARSLAWFEDDDPQDLLRWAVAAAVVVLIYAAAIGGYFYWHQQSDEDLGDESSAIAIEQETPLGITFADTAAEGGSHCGGLDV